MHRRLPVYLLLDCSESMAGEAWEAVKNGLAVMLRELQTNPMALETVALSLISFASTARQDVPLTDLYRFTQPKLRMGSGTALGAALRLWLDAMQREVKPTTANQKGDFKPVAFLLTDGEPTDDWQTLAGQVRRDVVGKKANLIGIGCGPDADLEGLSRVTGTVLRLKQQDEVSFSQFFQWVTASVSTASVGVASGGGDAIHLPGVPGGAMELAPAGGGPKSAAQRNIVLHARCVRDKRFFLYRYRKQEPKGLFGGGGAYAALPGAPIDEAEFDFSGAATGLTVASTQLGDPAPCPYCGNPALGMCDCGRVFCSPIITRQMTLACPWCGLHGTYAPAAFDVGRGAG